MTIFLTVIHVIVCLILILVILLQAGRGQGLSGPSFASGNVQSLLGTRAGDFLTKATSISAICFLFTCIGLNVLEIRKSKSILESTLPKSQMDLDTIKKALEQVQNQQSKPAEGSSGAVPAAVQEAANSVNQSAQQTMKMAQEKLASGSAALQEAIATAPSIPTEDKKAQP